MLPVRTANPSQKNLQEKSTLIYACAMRLTGRAPGIVGGLLLLCAVCGVGYLLLSASEPSLTRGLGEEKSLFQHAGTYYRLRPQLRGQKGNLETWDEAEIIVAVLRSKGAHGVWAAWSDKLDLVPQTLRLDPGKRPMCVIHLNSDVYVVRGVKKKVARCEAVQPGFGVSDVRSGELAPSSDGKAEIYYENIGNPSQISVPLAGETP